MANAEPRNPLYMALLLVSLVFVVNALAYAVIPLIEDKATQAGADVPDSPVRSALRQDGWKWLLVELGGMVVLGLASMWVDSQRLRRLQNGPGAEKMPTSDTNPPSTPEVADEESGSTHRGTAQAD